MNHLRTVYRWTGQVRRILREGIYPQGNHHRPQLPDAGTAGTSVLRAGGHGQISGQHPGYPEPRRIRGKGSFHHRQNQQASGEKQNGKAVKPRSKGAAAKSQRFRGNPFFRFPLILFQHKKRSQISPFPLRRPVREQKSGVTAGTDLRHGNMFR